MNLTATRASGSMSMASDSRAGAVPCDLGLDLGGTSVKAVVVTRDGRSLEQFQQPFDLNEARAFERAVRMALDGASDRWGTPDAVGVSAPGIAAPDGRCIAHMPGRFAGLEGLEWGRVLGRPDDVPVLNDAQAALLGEVTFGAARGARNVVLLTLGTGVGGAAMVDGHLLRGHTGKAGHLGHLSLDPDGTPDICRTPGSLENAIGNHNIRERSGGRFGTTHDLVRAAADGDPFAVGIWGRSVRALAAALASLGNVLDPEVVILGGGIARSEAHLFEPLRAHLDRWEWRPGGQSMRLVSAALGEWAGAYGAAAHAAARGR
ncbi:MAG: ROK family protein [Verrucomicrobia bacterium]|nr:ROK family protein [Verrucomicrobiota bacterium]